jgi:hypothetical protein
MPLVQHRPLSEPLATKGSDFHIQCLLLAHLIILSHRINDATLVLWLLLEGSSLLLVEVCRNGSRVWEWSIDPQSAACYSNGFSLIVQ